MATSVAQATPATSAPVSPPPAAAAALPPSASPVAAASGVEDDKSIDIGEPLSGDVVDMEVFGQLLEIDDDDEHEFSKALAFDYISQADATFVQIETALDARDLDKLSRLGHFLKGSSAALGLRHVQRSCELMQHFGNRKDEHGEGPTISEEDALKKCKALLVRLKEEQEAAKDWIEAFYK